MTPTPTEHHLLTSFLLPPAPLPSILSLKSFTSLFPPAQRSSPLIRLLYRHLQHQRNQLLDNISLAIDDEVKRGNAMRRAVARVRRADRRGLGIDDADAEAEIESALHAPLQITNLPAAQPHSLSTIIPEMEAAAEDIEEEIRRMEEECEGLVQGMRGTVGGLSDLRYGRLGDKGLAEGVREGLGRVEEVCGGGRS